MTRYAKLAVPLTLAGVAPKPRPEPKPGRIHVARKRLGPEAIQQMITDYEGGQSTAALAESYGLGKGTVLDMLAEHGVQMRGQGLPDDLLAEATRLYESHWV